MSVVEPKTLRGFQRVEQIKAAARVVYKRHGADFFTTELVAQEADCAIGTVYRYFEHRVDLLDAIAPDRGNEGIKELIGRIRDVPRISMNLDGLGDGAWVDGNALDALLQEYA